MDTGRSGSRLLVFAKAPRPGAVKTRLIPLLGAEGAAALHARFIEQTLELARASAIGPIDLYVTTADDSFLRECARRYGATIVCQTGADLGARMCSALKDALEICASAILVGTDCPALTFQHLQNARSALDTVNSIVLAPVEDGGYALIGANRIDPHVFHDIAWSTASVMAQTRQRLHELRWNWVELHTLWDVDRPEDYERLLSSGLLRVEPGAPREHIG